MQDQTKESNQNIPCEKIMVSYFCFKIFGIPIFSVSKAINEDELYRRLEVRFQHAMTTALHNATKG